MQLVKVGVLKAFEYRGRQLKAGDIADMVPIEAAAAAQRGRVTLTKPPAALVTAAMEADASAESTVDARPKRRYRRRDLQAEQ